LEAFNDCYREYNPEEKPTEKPKEQKKEKSKEQPKTDEELIEATKEKVKEIIDTAFALLYKHFTKSNGFVLSNRSILLKNFIFEYILTKIKFIDYYSQPKKITYKSSCFGREKKIDVVFGGKNKKKQRTLKKYN